MGTSMTVIIGPVVKLGQFDIEANVISHVNGCPNCKRETKDRFCKDCGSATITFETHVKNDIENAQHLLWEISSINTKVEDAFYTTSYLENCIIPNFRTSNTYIIDDYNNSSELILVPTIEQQKEAISVVEDNDVYKILKEFCKKNGIECDVTYAIFSYWG